MFLRSAARTPPPTCLLVAPFSLALAFGLAAAPRSAAADGLTAWVAGDGRLLGGTGQTFAAFRDPLAGLQAGIEVAGFDAYGEALFGDGQYYAALNLGFDLAWGDKTRFVAGLFTGPVYFHVTQTEADVTTLDTSMLTTAQRALIEAQVPGGLDRVDTEVSAYAAQEAALRESALGWNVARLRLDFERLLVPMLWVGVGGQLGYHFILTGADAAAEARREALDGLAAQYGLSQADRDSLADALGARTLTADSLDGLHWSMGAYLKFEI